MTTASVVMQGSLSDFNLFDVLQVVGISRQHTVVELRRQPRQVHGAIWLKAGRVLGAQCGTDRGRAAFFELFGPGADTFVVLRLNDPPSFNEPVGHLQMLLLEASNSDSDSLPEISVDGMSPAAEIIDAAPPPVPDVEKTTPPPPEMNPELTPIPSSAHAAPPPPPPTVASVAAPAVASVAPSKVKPKLVTAPAATRAAANGKPRSVALCSPKGGVGKTTLALNLAFALAQRGVSTVLVDADMNGDQMSLLNARERVQLGVYDILDKPESVNEALRDTALAKLKILPAMGQELPSLDMGRRDNSAAWTKLVQKLGERFEMVLVDCPAGMQGITQDVLSACSHALGVFQSEMIAGRNFELFGRVISAMPEDTRPEQLGVIINMFQGKSEASLEAFQKINATAPASKLFETTVPRHEAFQSASLAGLPLRFSEVNGASSIAFLFDMMANELCTRLGMESKNEGAKQFLT